MKRFFARFLTDCDGTTAVEYAVMLALVILLCLGAVVLVGQNTQQLWADNNTGLQSAFNP